MITTRRRGGERGALVWRILVSAQLEARALARGILESISDEQLVLRVPGTAYRLHLIPTVTAAEINTAPGKRIKGTIEARALRAHTAEGGGRFIEPVDGAPRIVAGAVIAVDTEQDRVLIDVAVPMWISLQPPQQAADFANGALLNCYVESGATFSPVGSS